MKIDNISKLLSALGNKPENQGQPKAEDAIQKQQSAIQQSDAVRIDPNFGRSAQSTQEQAIRRDKVSELKAQVQAKTYNPSTKLVAAALIKDLGI